MSKPITQRYPEKHLQLAAIEWLKTVRRYDEVYSDEEARGARVDSVGTIDGRLVLIEVKTRVDVSIVDHLSDRAHSIESKIAGILGPLFRREEGGVAEIANRYWDRRQPALVCVLAEKFGAAGLEALSRLFRRRSPEWLFDYAVWQWTGSAIVERDSGTIAEPDTETRYENVPVMRLIGRTNRAKPRSVADLVAEAAKINCDSLLEYFIDSARAIGFRVETGRTSVGLKARFPNSSKSQLVMGAYLDGSSTEGLNTGWWDAGVGLDIARLPGLQIHDKIGYLNSKRLLRSTHEIDLMLAEVFAAVQRSPSHSK